MAGEQDHPHGQNGDRNSRASPSGHGFGRGWVISASQQRMVRSEMLNAPPVAQNGSMRNVSSTRCEQSYSRRRPVGGKLVACSSPEIGEGATGSGHAAKAATEARHAG